jgi:hypothetical protein
MRIFYSAVIKPTLHVNVIPEHYSNFIPVLILCINRADSMDHKRLATIKVLNKKPVPSTR